MRKADFKTLKHLRWAIRDRHLTPVGEGPPGGWEAYPPRRLSLRKALHVVWIQSWLGLRMFGIRLALFTTTPPCGCHIHRWKKSIRDGRQTVLMVPDCPDHGLTTALNLKHLDE